MLRWYLIHTKPFSETLAKANLERQRYEVYLPRVAASVRRRGYSRERVRPLFPRYLFLHLNEGRQTLGPVRSSLGVAAVVRFGLHYAVVPDRIVGDLQARADSVTGLHRLSAPAALVRGESVDISGGAFDGLRGIFEREAGAARVIVLLRLLGQEVPVRVAADCVRSGQYA